jgi:alpha,alpha-trehalose phosphorylase
MASWRGAADHAVIPYDERLGVHPQSEGFTDHAVWDFEAMKPSDYPLLLNFPYFDLYRKQVVKQADLVLGMHLCSEAFTDAERIRNFAYYEAITVRDSSLSACSQATVAAQIGHLDLAHDYLGEAALVDLADLADNTREGIHMASHAGAWQALVEGFGGMRARNKQLSFAPWLPAGIGRLAFRIRYRGRRVAVTVRPTSATYEVLEGPPITITHHGDEVKVGTKAVRKGIPPAPRLPRPTQPKGREPRRRVPPVESQHAARADRREPSAEEV